MTSIRWVLHKHWHPEVRWYARIHAAWLVLTGYETEICGRCGGKVAMVWRAPAPVWWQGSGFPDDWGVLCPRCFDEQAREVGIRPHWECADGAFPICTGHPCAHQESMMIIAQQRDDLWKKMVTAFGDGPVRKAAAVALMEER